MLANSQDKKASKVGRHTSKNLQGSVTVTGVGESRNDRKC